MKNELIETNIKNMIYEVRGKQVMIDSDLARLYQIETRTLNQKVKRNINRFPTSFCFQMTEDEFFCWKSQFVMSNNDKIGLRRAPYVFTEQEVAMLATVLRTYAIENDTFHDRFIIIDNKDLYHCGASFKELGKKCFAISKIEDKCIIDNLIRKLEVNNEK